MALASRIVVVDDDPDILAMMEMLLTFAGYETVLHDKGDGTPQLVQEQRPALVILDMSMEHPEAGLQVVEALRQDAVTADTPVLICSAEREVEEKVARRHLKGVSVLSKPFHPDRLLEKVAALVKK